MHPLIRRFVALAGTVLLLAETPALDAERVIAQAAAPFAQLSGYTFDIRLDVAMKSFPYLAFRLDGDGKWQRPDLYSITFHHVPWFAKGFESSKIDPLQPQTWSQDFEFLGVTVAGDRRVISMQEKAQPGNMKAIHSEFDADGLRRIDWEYRNGGRIIVETDPKRVEGIPLPAVERIDLRLPGYHVFGTAHFSNYKLTRGEEPKH